MHINIESLAFVVVRVCSFCVRSYLVRYSCGDFAILNGTHLGLDVNAETCFAADFFLFLFFFSLKEVFEAK